MDDPPRVSSLDNDCLLLSNQAKLDAKLDRVLQMRQATTSKGTPKGTNKEPEEPEEGEVLEEGEISCPCEKGYHLANSYLCCP